MTLYESAAGATLPWNSIDAGSPLIDALLIDALPQQQIDICLMCPHHADACDKCDGEGNLRKTDGRPQAEFDRPLLLEMMRLKRSNVEMCAALGISRRTLFRAKRQILKEEQGT